MSERVKRIVDIKIYCEAPIWRGRHYHRYGTPEYWKAYEQFLKEWVSDFHAFIRDHRSQDPVSLDVEPEYQDQCSACGAEWETWVNEEGVELCASCGEPIGIKVSEESTDGR